MASPATDWDSWAQGTVAFFENRPEALATARMLGMPWGWREGTLWSQVARDLNGFREQRPPAWSMFEVWDAAKQIQAKPSSEWTPQEREVVKVFVEPGIDYYMEQNPSIARQLAPYRQEGEPWSGLMGREPEIGKALAERWGQEADTRHPTKTAEPVDDEDDPELEAAFYDDDQRKWFAKQKRGFQQELQRLRDEQEYNKQTQFALTKIHSELQDIRNQELYSHTKFSPTVDLQKLAEWMVSTGNYDAKQALALYNAPKAEEIGRQRGYKDSEQKRHEEGQGTPWRTISHVRKSQQDREQRRAELPDEARSGSRIVREFGKPRSPAETEARVAARVQEKWAQEGTSPEPTPVTREQIREGYREYHAQAPVTSGERLPKMPSSAPVESAA